MIKKLTILLAIILISAPSFAVNKNIVSGNKNAPVELKLYYSITCPACGIFQTKTIPQIERDFVKTGKVKIEYMPYPLDEVSLAVETFLACMPDKNNHEKALNKFLSTQNEWLRGEDVVYGIKEILSPYMTENAISKCEKNEESYRKLYEKLAKYKQKRIVRATPTLFINGKPAGSLSYKVIKEKINKELK